MARPRGRIVDVVDAMLVVDDVVAGFGGFPGGDSAPPSDRQATTADERRA